MQYDAEKRWYECVHRDADVDIWLISWVEEQDTGWHDHDVSSGAVAVEGSWWRSARARRPPQRHGRGRRGHALRLPRTSIGSGWRRRSGRSPIHAYSPPLWRLGVYAVDEEGVLRRDSVSYAEELRRVA